MDDEISLQYPKWTAPLGEKKVKRKKESEKKERGKKSKNREPKATLTDWKAGFEKMGSFFSFGKKLGIMP